MIINIQQIAATLSKSEEDSTELEDVYDTRITKDQRGEISSGQRKTVAIEILEARGFPVKRWTFMQCTRRGKVQIATFG